MLAKRKLMTKKKAIYTVLWILGACSAMIFFYPVLLGQDSTLLFRDSFRIYGPAKFLWHATVLSEGQIPRWNYFTEGGVPYYSNLNTGPLYPGNLIFLFFSVKNFFQAFNWFLATQACLSFLTWSLLALELSLAPILAILAGLIYAWSGIILGTVSMLNILHINSIIPIYFILMRRTWQKPTALKIWSLALPISLCIYAGEPVYAYVLAMISSVLLLIRSRQKAIAYIPLLAIAVILGSAAQLFPSVELLLKTSRGQERISLALAEQWSLHPIRLADFFLPMPFGSYAFPNNYWGERFVSGIVSSPFIISYYLGAIPLWFLFFAAKIYLRDWRRFAIPFAGILSIFFVAFGSYTPLYGWLHKFVPLWNIFRFPEKFGLLAVWILEGLALYAAVALVRDFRIKKYHITDLIFPSLCTLFLATCIGAGLLFCGERIHFSFVQSLFAVTAFQTLLGLSLWFAQLKKISHYSLIAVFFLIAILDGAETNFPLLWPIPKSIFDVSLAKDVKISLEKRNKELAQGAPRRFSSALLPPEETWIPSNEVATVQKLETPISQALRIYAVKLTPSLPTFYEIEDISSDTELLPQISHIHFWKNLAEKNPERLFTLMGVYYLPMRDNANEITIHTFPKALPYISFVHAAKKTLNFSSALSELRDSDYDPHQTTLIEGLTQNRQNTPNAKLQILRRESNLIDLEIHGIKNGDLLLWNENYDSFWHAYWKGKNLPVFKANAWAMAVDFENQFAEDGKLEIRYENPLIKAGAAATAGWILILLVLLVTKISVAQSKFKSHGTAE